MDKLKKIFSPGHENDEAVLYNHPKTISPSGARESPLQGEHRTSSSTKDSDLRHNVLDPQSNTSRPPISDNVSTASIRSGVVGAGQEPRGVEGSGFTDYGSSTGGLSAAQQTLPVRSASPAGQNRPRPSQMETADPRGFVTSSHAHKGLGHNYNGDPCPEGNEPFVPGYPHHQQGPHSTDIANALDPHVPGGFPSDDGLETQERRRDGGLSTTESTGSHHLGRDSALGAGAGAAAIGGYEALEHRGHSSISQTGAYDNTSSIGMSPSTTNRSFPLTSHPATGTSETSRDSHPGRDAALVGGGLGAAGLGAHEAGSHSPSREIEGYEDQRFDPSVASGDKATRIPNLMYGTSDKSTHSGQTDSTNYGRDAALAGGAGVAGSQLSGYNHGGRTETDPASKTIGPHKSNLMNIVDPRVQPEPEKMKDRTTSGPHQSDMMNRADPRVDSDLSKQGNHHGRDAALAGGAGAAGVGAYEYGQRHGSTTESVGSSTFAPGSTVTAAVADPNHDPILEQQRQERERALAAAMGSGSGAGGVAAYEQGVPHSSTGHSTIDSPFASRSTNQADVVGSNTDASYAQQQSHHGRDAAVLGGAGAAGAGAYEYNKHRGTDTSESIGSSAFDPRSTNTANYVDPNHDPILEQQRQERERALAAAMASGGAGTVGAGAYEHNKHHGSSATGSNVGASSFDPRSTNTSNVVDPSTDPTLAQQNQGHHYGRDAAVVGGTGAVGAGAYEYGKHHGSAADNNLGTSTLAPGTTAVAGVADPNHDPLLAQQREERSHFGRDAAVAGGAGAAGYTAAEALNPKEQEKLLKHQQKEREHELHKQEKALAKDREHQQKSLAAASQHSHEKEAKQHKHDLEKAEKQREKEADRSEKEAEKATRENEHPDKKKHGLLGFLHRDKKHEPEEDLRQQGRLQEADIAAHERHQRELEAAAARGSVPAAGARFEPSLDEQRANYSGVDQYSGIEEKGYQTVSTGGDGRHRLHKDPPASVLKERGLDSDQASYGSGSRGL
ncbi:hypothetical protein E4T43_00427 [Aureobasidium subglaciale]|nr:hypothetical protein E4T43_00427 [Aureobasidium subglaciale]